jgi:hypothetical protein
MSTQLQEFVEALILGDEKRALDLISPTFTVNDGLDALSFVRHEITEFRQRKKRDESRIAIKVDAKGDGTADAIVTSERGLLYAMNYHVDGDGWVGSNGCEVEIVGKMRFARNEAYRAAAIRAPNDTILAIAPLFAVENFWVTPSGESGQYSYLHFPNEFDVDQDIVRKIRVTFRNRKPLTAWISMPGRSSFARWQEDDMFPVVEENSILIPEGKSPVWNATAWLESGEVANFERPESGILWTLPDKVKMAVVTDALDNDWVSESKQ